MGGIINSSNSIQQTTSKDFIEQLKDFMTNTIIELQTAGKIPFILNNSKHGTPTGVKSKKNQNRESFTGNNNNGGGSSR